MSLQQSQTKNNESPVKTQQQEQQEEDKKTVKKDSVVYQDEGWNNSPFKKLKK